MLGVGERAYVGARQEDVLRLIQNTLFTLGLLVVAAGGIMLISTAGAVPSNLGTKSNTPARLYAVPAQVGDSRSDDDLGFPLMCRYDLTPIAVGDGDAQDLRCTQNGEAMVSPAAAAIWSTNLEQLNANDLSNPYDVNGGAGTESIPGVAVRTTGAAGASTEGVNLLLGGTAMATGAGVVTAQTPRIEPTTGARIGTYPSSVTVSPSDVVCDTTGNVGYATNPNDVTVWISNTDTSKDVCIVFGAGPANVASYADCHVYLGPASGAGANRSTAALPPGTASSWVCDTTATTATLKVLSWRKS